MTDETEVQKLISLGFEPALAAYLVNGGPESIAKAHALATEGANVVAGANFTYNESLRRGADFRGKAIHPADSSMTHHPEMVKPFGPEYTVRCIEPACAWQPQSAHSTEDAAWREYQAHITEWGGSS